MKFFLLVLVSLVGAGLSVAVETHFKIPSTAGTIDWGIGVLTGMLAMDILNPGK